MPLPSRKDAALEQACSTLDHRGCWKHVGASNLTGNMNLNSSNANINNKKQSATHTAKCSKPFTLSLVRNFSLWEWSLDMFSVWWPYRGIRTNCGNRLFLAPHPPWPHSTPPKLSHTYLSCPNFQTGSNTYCSNNSSAILVNRIRSIWPIDKGS